MPAVYLGPPALGQVGHVWKCNDLILLSFSLKRLHPLFSFHILVLHEVRYSSLTCNRMGGGGKSSDNIRKWNRALKGEVGEVPRDYLKRRLCASLRGGSTSLSWLSCLICGTRWTNNQDRSDLINTGSVIIHSLPREPRPPAPPASLLSRAVARAIIHGVVAAIFQWILSISTG